MSPSKRVSFFRAGLSAGALIAAGISSASAFACGASAGGAAGISGCSLEEHEEGARRKWRLGLEYAFTSTGLHFNDGLRVDQIRNASLATLDYRPLRRFTLEAGAGAFLSGSITAGPVRYAMAPGFVGIAGASWRVLDANGAIPFILLTSQISYFSSATSGDVGYNAFDLRAGAAVGTTIWGALSPYVVGRAFGGPVYWRYQGAAILGTDDHHWQVGAGFSLLLGHTVDVFVEGVPLGELGATAGVGVSL
ncbi:MAG TPA: hypothetical protein VEK07_13630 [Polyangiaceae bacterium]|nr:hypothetical protein [Polyangiaceae bacterium]